MLLQCGRIKSSIDDNTLKLIIKSIVRMQKSLDSRDDSVNQSIRLMLDDLQTNLSQDTTQQIGSILESMSGEFDGLKQWL